MVICKALPVSLTLIEAFCFNKARKVKHRESPHSGLQVANYLVAVTVGPLIYDFSIRSTYVMLGENLDWTYST